MTGPIALPAMTGAKAASWHALMDLHERLPNHWTLVGGQMVHLHCAERRVSPERPTDDLDAVVDLRADPDSLFKFTKTLMGGTARCVGRPCSAPPWRRQQRTRSRSTSPGRATSSTSRS